MLKIGVLRTAKLTCQIKKFPAFKKSPSALQRSFGAAEQAPPWTSNCAIVAQAEPILTECPLGPLVSVLRFFQRRMPSLYNITCVWIREARGLTGFQPRSVQMSGCIATHDEANLWHMVQRMEGKY